MHAQPLFSILTFPQRIAGGKLRVHYLVMPRNINPFEAHRVEFEEGDVDFVFAEHKLVLQPVVAFPPVAFPLLPPVDTTAYTASEDTGSYTPSEAKALLELLSNPEAGYFKVSQENVPEPTVLPMSVKKYLPHSYRESFHFTTPCAGAQTDDCYHCAIKKPHKQDGFKSSPEDVSWGQVFALCLRQPRLSQKLGLIRKFDLSFEQSDALKEGAWLYAQVGLMVDSVFKPISNLKNYAAPLLPWENINSDRALFAPNQFPVDAPVFNPDAFIESSKYDDGFAKIVHAFQPVNADPLTETYDGNLPTQEHGIRLGWDDEQVLTWMSRQLNLEDNPTGILGYRVDVENTENPGFHSLCAVSVKPGKQIKIGDAVIAEAGEMLELSTEVHPMELDYGSGEFWLPMYFTQWTGKSLAISDEDAVNINLAKEQITNKPNAPELNYVFDAAAVPLKYGKNYHFRVRMMDHTGGGPEIGDEAIHAAESSGTGACKFRRHVPPMPLRVVGRKDHTSLYFKDDQLTVKRPLLSYPGILFIDSLYADPVDRICRQRDAYIQQVQTWENQLLPEEFKERLQEQDKTPGLADPDVNGVEILVEVRSLEMDNALSLNGHESYIPLYRTVRNFPAVITEDDYEKQLNIEFEFVDVPMLQFGADAPGITLANQKITIPTARDVRVTFTPLCAEKANYYYNDAARRGKPYQIKLWRVPNEERTLIRPTAASEQIQALYLRADAPVLANPKPDLLDFMAGKQKSALVPPSIMQRLADQTGLISDGLSLIGKKGEHVQLACNRHIRHSLSPDKSSLTFATFEDLAGYWLVTTDFTLDRDWSWDAVKAFTVIRRKKFGRELNWQEEEAGRIELTRTASAEALQRPQRDYTRLVFIDAVKPKDAVTGEDPFPDTVQLDYKLIPILSDRINNGNVPLVELPDLPSLTLPVTTPPDQTPKIVSAGVALTPYLTGERYRATEPRRQYLWLEFAEPCQDPNDAYFIRFLAYAPDPWMTNLNIRNLESPAEPPLPIADEWIRVITPNHPQDQSGLDAMQEMEKATSSDTHFLVPLPPGLHADSDELFGFFTYEIRIGHKNIWSTARGRFSDYLRVTGVQHPSPGLHCQVARNNDGLWVHAPFARAVLRGADVTARAPRTQLWALLYTQVRTADGKGWRNILLDDRLLWKSTPELYDRIYQQFGLAPEIQMLDFARPGAHYGVAFWSRAEIETQLSRLALPASASLSVITVEMMPRIDYNDKNHNTPFPDQETLPIEANPNESGIFREILAYANFKPNLPLPGMKLWENDKPRPLRDDLGKFRMLRNSPLTPAEDRCCVD